MIHELQNGQYKIGVQEEGAELCSFLDKKEQLEYIWQANPRIWPRHAPVLFPIVGKVPEGKYTFGDKIYNLPQHGFARDQKFTLIERTDTTLAFELTDSPVTKAIYPFAFRLVLKYILEGNSLVINYTVQNPSAEENLYFSIGGHPGFNCPLFPATESFTDYYLEFDKPETQNRYLLSNGLQNGETEPVLQNQDILPLKYDLFEKDAVVLKGLASEKISLKTAKHAHGLDFEFKDFPYFGIWTKEPGAPFICLEPWHGIAGSINNGNNLAEKEGVILLEPKKDFTCAYAIKVY